MTESRMAAMKQARRLNNNRNRREYQLFSSALATSLSKSL